jgi:peptidoglycan/LPS O-acetylase OafA/YrhL
VRGIAIVMVLLLHFRLAAAVGPLVLVDHWVLRTVIAGWTGVDLFFVLSGFLITGILWDAKTARGAGYFNNFYARRVLRIFPACYLLLFALIAVLPFIGLIDQATRDGLWSNSIWYATYLSNFWLPIEGQPITEVSYVGHLWSLAVEEQFYLVWPALVLILDRRSLIAVCAGFIIGAPLLRIALALGDANGLWGYMLTPARMDTLAVGGLIALLARSSVDLRALLRRALPAAGAAVAILVVLALTRNFLDPYDKVVQGVGFSALALLFGVVLLAAITARPGSLVQRALSVGASGRLRRWANTAMPSTWCTNRRRRFSRSTST